MVFIQFFHEYLYILLFFQAIDIFMSYDTFLYVEQQFIPEKSFSSCPFS